MCAAPLPSTPNLPSLHLLESAATLLADLGPHRVTPESIAEHAGVSVGTILAIWPGPLDPACAALDYLGECIGGALGPERATEKLGDLLPRVLGATAQHERYWRILSWSLLEGHHPLDLGGEYPVIQRMMRAAERSDAAVSPEALVAGLSGAGMGLLMYGTYLQTALGQGESRWARTRSELVTLLRRMMLRAERRSVH
jgi:hypothetical protein